MRILGEREFKENFRIVYTHPTLYGALHDAVGPDGALYRVFERYREKEDGTFMESIYEVRFKMQG